MAQTGNGGFLTTHILDTARGCPASAVGIELFSVSGHDRQLLATAATNNDGRTDKPLLAGNHFTTGTYELVFHAGDYLRATSNALPEPLFLDVIPVRFGISDASSHYHVPLLISPHGYSTYRGS